MSSAAPKKSAGAVKVASRRETLTATGIMRKRRLGNQMATKWQPCGNQVTTTGRPAGYQLQPRAFLFPAGRENGKRDGRAYRHRSSADRCSPWSLLNNEPGRLVIDNASAYPPCGGRLRGCPRPGEGEKRRHRRGRHYFAGVRTNSGVAPGAGELRPKGV